VIADDIYQCLNISIYLYFGVSTLKYLSNMNVARQSLYHQPGGEAVLREFVDYFYDFMESLTELKSVREKYAVDLIHAGEHEYDLLKS
jgi:hypothetical protein